jgi:branched-chain amino acid transport system ATP-binding protein
VTLLEVHDVHTYIGPFHILQGVTFKAENDVATVLLGRNGAGKTTTLTSIMGMTPPKSGQILFKGENLTKQPTYKIAQAGITYVPSKRRIFGHLTVEESLKLAYRKQQSAYEDRLDFIIAMFPDLKGALKMRSRNLSGGQQKMLLIACAMISENQLLLVDEPSEGLSPLLVKKFTETLVNLKKEIPIVLVEQNLKMAKEIGDACYILEMGRIVQQGSMTEIAENEELLQRHLGVSI